MTEKTNTTKPDPSHIQITPLSGGDWGWVVWFGGDAHPLDREGTASSVEAAIGCVKEVIHD